MEMKLELTGRGEERMSNLMPTILDILDPTGVLAGAVEDADAPEGVDAA